MARKGRYHVAEIFYSLQGEGHRKGTANIFLRFAGCNLQCNVAEHGFDCDTDFTARETFGNADHLVNRLLDFWSDEYFGKPSVILTGGEPTLQVDDALIDDLKAAGFYIAIETNGTNPVHPGIDWVSCSPKPGEMMVIASCDEVRVVIDEGQMPGDELLPKAKHYFVSPAFDGNTIKPGALEWAIDWCLSAPLWRLSVQDHKVWGVR